MSKQAEAVGTAATELAAALYAKPRRSATSADSEKALTPSPEQRREAVSLHLWARLAEIFGAVFITQYGDVDGPARQTWKQAMEQFSEAQIARGVENCMDWAKRLDWRGSGFPPNLPQFLELCLTVPPSYYQPYDASRALELKPASRETAEKALAEIRGILSGVAS